MYTTSFVVFPQDTIGSPEITTFSIKENIQYSPENCKLTSIYVDEFGKLVFCYQSFSKVELENFMIDYKYEPSIPRKKQTFIEWLFLP